MAREVLFLQYDLRGHADSDLKLVEGQLFRDGVVSRFTKTMSKEIRL